MPDETLNEICAGWMHAAERDRVQRFKQRHALRNATQALRFVEKED